VPREPEEIQNDSAPKVVSLASDAHEEFVEVPRITQTPLSTPQLPSVIRTEFPTPLPNRLVGDNDPALGQKIFDIAEAQAEPVIQPDGVADDFGRKPVSVVAIRIRVHPRTLSGSRSS